MMFFRGESTGHQLVNWDNLLETHPISHCRRQPNFVVHMARPQSLLQAKHEGKKPEGDCPGSAGCGCGQLRVEGHILLLKDIFCGTFWPPISFGMIK